MHPGNKWPSVTMCTVLICSLLLIGYLNTGVSKGYTQQQQLAAAAKNNVAFNHTSVGNSPILFPGNNTAAGNSFNMITPAGNNNTTTVQAVQNTTVNYNQNASNRKAGNTILSSGKPRSINQHAAVVIAAAREDELTAALAESNPDIADDNVAVVDKPSARVKQNTIIPANINNDDPIASISGSNNNMTIPPAGINSGTAKQNNASKVNTKGAALTLAEKEWIENFAFYNAPVKKWKGKLAAQMYATPSVVYRRLYNNAAGRDIGGNGTGNFNNANVENVVVQKPSFGIEAGVALQYDVLKILKLKAGLQLNYTRYNAHGFENNHPVSSSIIVNSENDNSAYEVSRATPYSNTYGINPVKLHNETYQVSIPVGADVQLLSVDNVSWYAGATIQPTWVVFGNSYLISADRHNYVHDNSMLNHFNLNAGFETYLSFKKNGYSWQIGPQFRSQLFSTNSKVYSVEERLMNFGLKIGITKKL